MSSSVDSTATQGKGAPAPPPSIQPVGDQVFEAGKEGIRKRVVSELHTTEVSYRDGLSLIIKEYLQPLRTGTGDAEGLGSLVKPEKVATLFQNIEQIEDLSKFLVAQLENAMKFWKPASGIGAILIPHASTIKTTYSSFMENYDKAARLLNKLMEYQKFADFANVSLRLCFFVTEAEKVVKRKPVSVNRDLSSVLITPIQRIPRYILLVREYLKVTEDDHPDKVLAVAFSQEMEKLASLVNKSIEREQNRVKLIEVEKSIMKLPSDVKESILSDHLLIREGYLNKVCRKATKKRYFWFFSDLIVYGTPLSEGASVFTFHRAITISKEKGKVINLPDDGSLLFSALLNSSENAFQIVTVDKSFTVVADDITEKKAWVRAFSTLFESECDRNSGPATELAPVWVPDKYSTSCMTCGNSFSFLRRRVCTTSCLKLTLQHHCRNCGIVICADCCKNKVLPNQGDKPVRVCNFCYELVTMQDREASAHPVLPATKEAEPPPAPVAPIIKATIEPPLYVVMHTSTLVIVALLNGSIDPQTIKVISTDPVSARRQSKVQQPSQLQIEISGVMQVSTEGIDPSSHTEELVLFSTNAPVKEPALFKLKIPIPYECKLENAVSFLTKDKVIIAIDRVLPQSVPGQPLIVVRSQSPPPVAQPVIVVQTQQTVPARVKSPEPEPPQQPVPTLNTSPTPKTPQQTHTPEPAPTPVSTPQAPPKPSHPPPQPANTLPLPKPKLPPRQPVKQEQQPTPLVPPQPPPKTIKPQSSPQAPAKPPLPPPRQQSATNIAPLKPQPPPRTQSSLHPQMPSQPSPPPILPPRSVSQPALQNTIPSSSTSPESVHPENNSEEPQEEPHEAQAEESLVNSVPEPVKEQAEDEAVVAPTIVEFGGTTEEIVWATVPVHVAESESEPTDDQKDTQEIQEKSDDVNESSNTGAPAEQQDNSASPVEVSSEPALSSPPPPSIISDAPSKPLPLPRRALPQPKKL